MQRHEKLEKVIAPAVEGLGFEFVGLEYLSQGKHSTLRVYIDSPDGASIDGCAKVSRQIGSVLEVESNLVRGEYTLEVSSPGIERKLFTLEQFPRFVGRKLRVTVRMPVEGQRNFTGILSAIDGERVSLDVDGSALNLDYANIANANVIDENTRL